MADYVKMEVSEYEMVELLRKWSKEEDKRSDYECFILGSVAYLLEADKSVFDQLFAYMQQENARQFSNSKPETNGELIRSMSDEELAKAVLDISDSGIYIGFCRELPRCVQELDEGGVPEERCLECVKLWLNSPAEEEKT